MSSSGGVFSALAERVISDGGVVYGASFDDNWGVAHKRIADKGNLHLLRGSKYVYSAMGSSISDALSDLKSNRFVLFSGTPCQAAAMRKAAGNDANLLIVEVVCHGAPEQKYWRQYLTELCATENKSISDIANINFRDKSNGWLNYNFKIAFKDGSVYEECHKENLFMKGFLSDLTLREACFKCQFKQPHDSKADMTIGDFWGIEEYIGKTDDAGISLVILNTTNGESFFEAYKDTLHTQSFDFDSVIRNNRAVIQPPCVNVNAPLFKRSYNGTNLLATINRYTSGQLYYRLLNKINRIICK